MAVPSAMHDWAFDEGGGDTAADAIGHATMTLSTPSWRTGHLGGGVRFNPSDGTRGASTLLRAIRPPWTVAFWVKRESDDVSPDQLSTLFSDGVTAIRLEQYEKPRRHAVGFTIFDDNDYAFGYATKINEWTHLALVGAPSDITLYVNGQLQGKPIIPGRGKPIHLPLCWIGSRDGCEIPSAILDELRVYGQALTVAEVKELYEQSLRMAPKLVIMVDGQKADSEGQRDLGAVAVGQSRSAKIEVISGTKATLTYLASGGDASIAVRLPSAADIPVAPGAMLSAYTLTLAPKVAGPLSVAMNIKSDDPAVPAFTYTVSVNAGEAR